MPHLQCIRRLGVHIAAATGPALLLGDDGFTCHEPEFDFDEDTALADNGSANRPHPKQSIKRKQ
jgi:hypothetical protein